ncbi:MAG: tetratricopeptide repeat protein [Candidatus Margulisiibacteriota bacterium]
MKQSMEDLKEIREALKIDPNDPYALKAVGKYYLKEGYYKLAKNHYNQAVCLCPHLLPEIFLDFELEIKRDPEKIGPRLSLAGFEITQGDIESSILELEESLQVSPKNVETYNVLGKIFVKLGRIDEAIALLERSQEEGVRDVSLTGILAGAYLEKGRIPEAIKFYEEILNYRPGDKQTLRILGELYARLENYNQAAQSYQAMFSDDPEVGREVIQRLEELLKKIEGNVFIREVLADVYMKSLKPEAAVTKLREIVRLDTSKLGDVVSRLKEILKIYPSHPQAMLALAEVLRLQGNFSESVENYYNLTKNNLGFLEEALRGYQKILEFCPQQILARTYLAEAYLYKKQIKEALIEFESMLGVDPSSSEAVIRKCREIIKINPQLQLAHLVLGRAYLVRGDVQRAVMEAEGVISIDKKNTPAYLLLGEAYFNLKLSRKAVEVLHSALSLDPYNQQVQERYREAREKEIELEIGSIKKGVSEDPWRISFHLDLAKLYIQKGLREEAVRELQMALKDQARAPFACNLLGCVHRGAGRYDLAAAQFNRALELAPSEIPSFARTARFNITSTHEAQGNVRKAIKGYESILQEDIDFGNLKRRVKHLKATSLQSIRNKALLMVVSRCGEGEIVALWGREGKGGQAGRKEDVRVSFGQNYNNSGFEYFMKAMHKAAIEEFLLAVQLDARFGVALNNLGVAMTKEGKFTEAKGRLEEAVQLEPHSVVFRNNLGVLYFLLGQIDQAKLELEKAYSFDPELSGVCINLGDICYFKKDIRRAIDLYKRAGNFDVLTELAEQRLAYKTP